MEEQHSRSGEIAAFGYLKNDNCQGKSAGVQLLEGSGYGIELDQDGYKNAHPWKYDW